MRARGGQCVRLPLGCPCHRSLQGVLGFDRIVSEFTSLALYTGQHLRICPHVLLFFRCRECILGVIATNPKCPLCRRTIVAPDLRQGVTAAEADAEEAAAEAAAAAAEGGKGEEGAAEAPPAEQVFVSESKLQALLKEVRGCCWGGQAAAEAGYNRQLSAGAEAMRSKEWGEVMQSKEWRLMRPRVVCCVPTRHGPPPTLPQLRNMRRTDPTAKALIFSQYVSTIGEQAGHGGLPAAAVLAALGGPNHAAG